MIGEYDEDSFGKEVAKVLQPAQPINREEQLHGRSAQLMKIRRAMHSPGQHVFIFGDRGVGKSSLAQTASGLHQLRGLDDVIVACDNGSSFYELVQDIARKLIPDSSLIERRASSHEASLNFGGVSASIGQSVQKGIIPPISTINDAGQLLREATSHADGCVVVVVDEFDQLTGNENRKLFADLIKHVSDTGIPVRFIICGIGGSLSELIGVHLSTDRYITPVELEPISHDARWAIIQAAADFLDVLVDDETKVRIGQISDGFPYYVHLIGQNMFWAASDDQEVISRISVGHFQAGVNGAVENAQTSLRNAYNQATQKYEGGRQYETVLWAVADSTNFQRATSEIFENSYFRVCRELQVEPVAKQTFYNRMNSLKKESHGCILNSPRRSWYEFSENMVRGYVRLQAAKAGLDLGQDHHLGTMRR